MKIRFALPLIFLAVVVVLPTSVAAIANAPLSRPPKPALTASPGAALRNKLTASPAAGLRDRINIVKITGAVASLGTNSFTVVTTAGTSTVNVLPSTMLLRRFGGKSALSEFSVGDQVEVMGKTAADGTSIDARVVRNTSIQKRQGTFFGAIQTMTPTGFTIQPLNRPLQTVTLNAKTRLVDRRERIIKTADLAIGHKVRVRGLWDNKLNTITEVVLVKDFSLPVLPVRTTATPSALPVAP